MAKLKVDDLIKGLKHVESKRSTFYSNAFPYNCGFIHANGQQSFDCIGLVKCPINEPDIFYRTSPEGYYVKPGKVIPDTTEIGILNLCTDVSKDFHKLVKGEYLYMGGHGAWFVGDYTDPSGVVNVIECTPAFGGGVVSSYVDQNGYRYNHKGGFVSGRWESHGKLSKYIEYEKDDKGYEWKQEWHLYKEGKELTGWQKVNGKWYFLDEYGAMKTGWIFDSSYNGWFLLSANGDMLTGWQKVDGKWYYLEANGKMHTGWLQQNGKWYFLDLENGDMYIGTHTIGGKTYTFNSKGELIS